MSKARVFFISSWKLFSEKDAAVIVPFIYEQVGVLAQEVEAVYVEPQFCSLYNWMVRWSTNAWMPEVASRWDQYPQRVRHFRLYLPRLPTRLTKNSIYRDLEWAAYWMAKRIVKKTGPIDLIHIHTVLPLGALALGVKRRLNIPFLLQEHSAPFEMHLESEEKRIWVSQILDQAARIVAVGPALETRLKEICVDNRSKICVIPEMIRTDIFQVSENVVGETVNLISIGALVARKGYDLLLTAVKGLRDQGYPIRLWIVGEGEERGKLEQLIQAIGIGEVVTLTGHLSKTQMNELMDSMNIYVHSSHRETFGIAPTEAMLKGRPVVSTICEGPEYYVSDDNGILVEAGSSAAIAEGIKSAITKLSTYDVHKVRASISDRFGERTFVKHMVNVYSEIGL